MKILAISAILALGLTACSSNDDNRDREEEVPCIPPYACGPMYVNYVPVFYQVHPYSLYFSPYQSSYNYSYSNGRRVVTGSTGRPRVAQDSRIKWVTPPKANTNTGTKSNTGTTTKQNTGTVPKTAPKTSTGKK